MALYLKPFLLVLPTIAMENWFSLSPRSICFHVYQAFASKILLQGTPVHVGLPSAENGCQKGPCCRKSEHGPAQALDKTFVQTCLLHLNHQCCQSTSRARGT